MKIGILTLPLNTNYGGILQAYALQTILERMGHNVCIIEETRKPLSMPLWKAPLVYGKRILKNLLGHPFPIFYEYKINHETPIVRQNTDKFINKYIKCKIVDSFYDLYKNDFDAIVIGSDQIWRPKYFPQIEHAYLDFTEGWNIRRIAYAASFGTDDWEYTMDQTKRCKELIDDFNNISVREISGVYLCLKYFGVNVEFVLDPTMLLSKEDYIQLFRSTNIAKSKGTLLNYILDESPEKNAIIEKISKEKGLIPFRVNSKVENKKAKLKERIQPPVEQWLRGFYDAKFVVTDSFHACVFSIIFNKPFIAVGNMDRGLSRFESLLTMFGLEERIINVTDAVILSEIDWDRVNKILNDKRLVSKNFLINCFS